MQHLFFKKENAPDAFQELVGLDTEAATLATFVDFVWSTDWDLHHRTLRFMPTILLYGPPGTGKTTILRNLAAKYSGESLEYYRESLDLFAHKDLGETSKAVESLFSTIKERASCGKKVLLQLDDVDSLLSSRHLVNESSGVRRAVNTFLNQLDDLALDKFEFQPIVSATTNLLGNLDLAIKRRFSLKVEVNPELSGAKLKELIQPILSLCSPQLSPDYQKLESMTREKKMTPSDVIRAVQVVYLQSRSGVAPTDTDIVSAFASADSSAGEYSADR
jgi:SpoVK/Ycf46/Vps4 family AAA+-type ATPase